MLEELLDLALKSGAEEAEVFQTRTHSRVVLFEANRLKSLETVESEGTVLRLWRGGRPGLAVAYGDVEPQEVVDRAVTIGQLNEPETIELAEGRGETYPDLGKSIAVEQMLEWGWEAIEMIRDRYPELLCAADWECDVETTRTLNSRGLDCHYTDTTLSAYISTEWVRGDDFLNVSDGQTRRNSLDPRVLVEQILQRLEWARDNVPPPTGRIPILFTSKAADLLWGTVQAALNGKQAIEGASPWSDRLKELVVSPSLTLYQEPNAGPFSCPFDDEGTPTRPSTFVKDGVVQLFYTDRRIGRLLGSGTTGNGFRPNLESYPTPGLFNLLVQPGDRRLRDMIGAIDEGIIVDQMLGGGGGISGDCSLNVDLGYRIQNGEVVGRIKDTMVAGNTYTALKEAVALGSDADWNGHCYTPSIVVEGFSVTGRQR